MAKSRKAPAKPAVKAPAKAPVKVTPRARVSPATTYTDPNWTPAVDEDPPPKATAPGKTHTSLPQTEEERIDATGLNLPRTSDVRLPASDDLEVLEAEKAESKSGITDPGTTLG